MESQNNKNSYTCVLLFKEGANKTSTQLLTFSYAQFLKKLGAIDIRAYNKSSYTLAYPIKKSTKVKFIEVSFSIIPEALNLFTRKLRLDESLLRFFLTKND
jgi:ribosomal protein S6